MSENIGISDTRSNENAKQALDDMIIFIDDFHPTEEQCIEHLAEICSGGQQ